MITIKTTSNNLHIFLSLTGHAFSNTKHDPNKSHGFYWAMRWLAHQVIGKNWLLWCSLSGGE